MRIIPVFDLQGGHVVQAVAGERSRYRPVRSVLAHDARPGPLARAFVEYFGFRAAYVADLDAIAGKQSNATAWEAIAAAGLSILLDAGVGTLARVQQLAAFAVGKSWLRGIIVALEAVRGVGPQLGTDDGLAAAASLAACSRTIGPERAVFSLDLKEGNPLTSVTAWRGLSVERLGQLAVDAGYARLIVLDLARVGGGRGVGSEDLCRDLRRQHPGIELISGGGVRGVGDLRRLADVGCDAALVASALHDGRLTPEDVRAGTLTE